MIIDQRTYTITAHLLPKYLELYEREGMTVQTRHLGHLVGFFTGDCGPVNQVVHLWRYDSLADREVRRDALNADPEWQAYKEKAMPMVQFMESRILRPTGFSPMR